MHQWQGIAKRMGTWTQHISRTSAWQWEWAWSATESNCTTLMQMKRACNKWTMPFNAMAWLVRIKNNMTAHIEGNCYVSGKQTATVSSLAMHMDMNTGIENQNWNQHTHGMNPSQHPRDMAIEPNRRWTKTLAANRETLMNTTNSEALQAEITIHNTKCFGKNATVWHDTAWSETQCKAMEWHVARWCWLNWTEMGVTIKVDNRHAAKQMKQLENNIEILWNTEWAWHQTCTSPLENVKTNLEHASDWWQFVQDVSTLPGQLKKGMKTNAMRRKMVERQLNKNATHEPQSQVEHWTRPCWLTIT